MRARERSSRRPFGWLGSSAIRPLMPSLLVLFCVTPAADAAPPPPPSCEEAPYDVDGNSQVEPLTDGLLMLRYFFGFRGSVLIAAATGQGCTRCTAPLIEDFIEFALAGCAVCGDALIDPGEACDGANLGGETCESQGHEGGTLGCTDACAFDVSACHSCGNGVIDSAEEMCDGNDHGGASCVTFGFLGGNLACTDSCGFDTSNCES